MASQIELQRRARRASMTKYEKLADVNEDGLLTDDEKRQASLYQQNWTQLGFSTPTPSVYDDEEDPEPSAARAMSGGGGATDIGAAALEGATPAPKKTHYMGVPLLPTDDFGTNAGHCRKFTEAERWLIQQHMEWKVYYEAKWAEKYMCSPATKKRCYYA